MYLTWRKNNGTVPFFSIRFVSEFPANVGDGNPPLTPDGHVLRLQGVGLRCSGSFGQRYSKTVRVIKRKNHQSIVFSGWISNGGDKVLTSWEEGHGEDTVLCVELPFIEAIWNFFLPSFVERKWSNEKTLDLERRETFEGVTGCGRQRRERVVDSLQ